jgi:hypothetical protein
MPSRPYARHLLTLVFLLLPLLLPAQQQQSQDLVLAKVGELPTPRQMHGSVVLGDWLYVIGGELGGTDGTDLWTETVLKTPLSPDGQIGPWTPTTPLPHYRAYIGNSTITLNDVVYVVGGSNGVAYNTAYISKPLPDGNLGPWIESPPFSTVGLTCFPVVATPGFIHVIGGADQSDRVSPAVISGKIGVNGEILSWEAAPFLPVPLWFESAASLAGRVWVWGGLTDKKSKTASTKTFSAPILSDGRLGQWQEEPQSLPEAFYGGTCSSAGPYLITFAPTFSGQRTSSDVWFSSMNPAGLGMKPWTKLSSNLATRLYLGVAPDYRRGRAYIPGGRVRPGDTGEGLFDTGVYMFNLSPKARQEYRDEATSGDAVRTGSYTYLKADILPPEAVPGFLSLNAARRFAQEQPRKPVVLYFHKSGMKTCDVQVEALKDPAFAELTKKAAFAWMDTDTWPQLRSQLGIYRVPTWIVYDPNTRERGRASQVITLAQLQQFLSGVK